MKPIKKIVRLLYIQYVLAKNGLDQLLVSMGFFSSLRVLVYLNPWNWLHRNKRTRGEALRQSLETLGPIFIKFGQALSTRPDVIPSDIATELAKLQDKVPPFSSIEAQAIVETTLGKPLTEIFTKFDPIALASASIAQVHAATLKNGADVVVKILRPNVQKIIKNDLSILYTIAGLIEKYWAGSRRFKPREIVREFERSLLDELDFKREAANAGQLRRNFARSPLLYVPEVCWEYVHTNILVMERIYGIPVNDLTELRQHGINIKKLAETGVEIFFTQVFRDCFFHADMHPGNIFVSFQHLENPQYICIDFGIMGTLNESDKYYLAQNMLAFFNRDFRRVAALHVESGWVARDTQIEVFESAIRTVCEPIFEKPLKDISLALVVLHLFHVARRFNMEVQPQLVLLQKTLLAIEGLGRQLYPDLDLWATAKPFLEKWLRSRLSLQHLFKNLRESIPFFIEQAPHFPRLLYDVMQLTKQQTQLALEQQVANKKQDPSKAWWPGIFVGIFVTIFTGLCLNYFNLLH